MKQREIKGNIVSKPARYTQWEAYHNYAHPAFKNQAMFVLAHLPRL